MLKDIRERKQISQSELANMTGINVRTIQSYEAKEGRNIDGASLETLIDLSIALKCNISELLNDENLINKCKKTTL